MRLKSIKLSGFKSFVDPTTLPLRNNLIGVVGPNGCGKSNIVDALRWVLGESSARQLRGDALADVIFSGSSGRKPVGQASVELVFDNSDGSLTGSYGQYGEISVRRQATRDGQSVYFLNGARCRRRDVTDLFLGTGLGPRSYAIIEQGMISRLIEARPEELRNFIEEAAGISRYKERRRETETRIGHTRENMDRVADLQDELAKRLITLKRQAETAERFAKLKERQREIAGQLFTVEFAALTEAAEKQHQLTAAAELELESLTAKLVEQEKSLEQQRQQQATANASLAEVQRTYYEAGAEIAGHEQAVSNAREALQRLQQVSEQLHTQQRELEQHLQEDAGQREQIEQQLAEAEPELARLNAEVDAQQQSLQELQDRHQQITEVRETCLRDQRDATRRREQESQSVKQLQQRLQRLADAHQRLQQQMQASAETQAEEQIGQLTSRIAALNDQLKTLDQAIDVIDQGRQSRSESCQQLETELDQRRTALQVLRGEHSSLQALQDNAQTDVNSGNGWLQEQGLDQLSPLFNEIQVEPSWQQAVERALGNRLSARLVESMAVAGKVDIQAASALVLLERNEPPSSKKAGKPNQQLSAKGHCPLIDKISSQLDLVPLLTGYYAIGNLQQALECRKHLEDGELLVTADGV
ncbi:MAG: AAA family ATPase, partial [Gammaproteobacteria bacterium]